MQPPPAEDLSVPSELTIGQCVTLACTWEVATPKPGNVHRGADFEDLTFLDFLTSAVAIGPAMERAVETGLGQTVLAAVEATHQWVGTNTNLGTILLLAPLAKVPRKQSLQAGIGDVLAQLNAEDAHQVYQAIRIANPGGLGQVAEMDVGQEAPPDLRAAMRVAANTDLVARQYANDYNELFAEVLPWMHQGLDRGRPLGETILQVQLQLMRTFPDTLIARKCGPEVAQEAARRAEQTLASGAPGDPAYLKAVADLDFWLRSDGHRRNPGTTADMLAAGLFSLLRDGKISADCPPTLGSRAATIYATS